MNTQLELESAIHRNNEPQFHGSNYEPKRDEKRLCEQQKRIAELMSDGKWRSLGDISGWTGDGESSISAQLRHLRNKHGYNVEKRYVGGGLWQYRVSK